MAGGPLVAAPFGQLEPVRKGRRIEVGHVDHTGGQPRAVEIAPEGDVAGSAPLDQSHLVRAPPPLELVAVPPGHAAARERRPHGGASDVRRALDAAPGAVLEQARQRRQLATIDHLPDKRALGGVQPYREHRPAVRARHASAPQGRASGARPQIGRRPPASPSSAGWRGRSRPDIQSEFVLDVPPQGSA